MTFRSILRLAVRAALVALATASVNVGCSRQGEGERCDLDAAGHDDCDSGLICISCGNLADHVTDRCCPDGASSDPRCQRSQVDAPDLCARQTGSGGSAGSAGTAGTAGTAGSGAGGAGNGGGAGSTSGGTAGEDEPAGAGGA